MLPQLGVHLLDLDSEGTIVYLRDVDIEIIIKTVNCMFKKLSVERVKWGQWKT